MNRGETREGQDAAGEKTEKEDRKKQIKSLKKSKEKKIENKREVEDRQCYKYEVKWEPLCCS